VVIETTQDEPTDRCQVGSGKSQLHDSGERQGFPTGAHRDIQGGKGRFDLIMLGWPRVILRLAQHMERGYDKYGWKDDGRGNRVPEAPHQNNWTRGIPLSRFLDSALRHQNEWLLSDKREPWHFIAMLWNFMCLAETWFRIQEGLLPQGLDDLGGLKIVYDEQNE
jgi:hypothetical protein